MNILFVEDEKALSVTGVAQLELKGYTVYPAYDLAEARAIMEDVDRRIDFIIADQRLPDGPGGQFVIEMIERFPRCKCAIVSGCLLPKDIEVLESHKIPYHHKPLLYSKVMDDLRRRHAQSAAVYVEPKAVEETPVEAAEEKPAKKRKGLKLWSRK